MDHNQILLVLILGIVLFVLFRIRTLRRWISLNVDMKKGSSGRYSPDGSLKEFENERERQMRLKKHRIALRMAKNPKMK